MLGLVLVPVHGPVLGIVRGPVLRGWVGWRLGVEGLGVGSWVLVAWRLFLGLGSWCLVVFGLGSWFLVLGSWVLGFWGLGAAKVQTIEVT